MKKLFKIVFTVFIFTNFLCQKSFAEETIIWNSFDGLKRLEQSNFKNDFYQLVNYYQPQNNPLYCSIATGTIFLNALKSKSKIPSQKENEVKKPEVEGGEILQFNSYSQQSFLNDKTDKIKKREIIQLKEPLKEKNGNEIYNAGLTLSEFAQILSKVYGLKVTINYAERSGEEMINNFRDDLKKYLSDNKNFIAINIDGKVLDKKTKGHVSPIAAYDEKSDSVLVLDVALHKNQWYWVSVKKLYEAMNTKDKDSFRGYVVVRK